LVKDFLFYTKTGVKKMRKPLTLAICIGVLLTGFVVQTQAAKPEDKIKFRQSGMMFMRWNMGIIKEQVITNPQAYDREQVIAAAKVISAIANSGIGILFSSDAATGKGWHDTRVKSAYFQQPDKVKEVSQNFITQANEMTNAAITGDIGLIKSEFNKLFDTCKGCHKHFRNK
jgi:cytochrome c556